MKIRLPETTASGATTAPLMTPSSRTSEFGYVEPTQAQSSSASRPTFEPPLENAAPEITPDAMDATMAESPLPKAGSNRASAAVSENVRWTSNDVYGAFSLETFADVGGLTYTHEDAQGWLDFLGGTGPANFWYKDANVQPWAYYETYDNWQDTYGLDAVLAAYHSGHGGMDANGVFWAPVGANWGGLGTWVHSDQMRLGNEQVNYLFWSTCLSCRVLGGQNPIKTWSAANLGFRMLFGFETVSWDSPNYGKFFGDEWRKGKSLSTAWLDASWRIAHDQAPSVVACGATVAEAQNRLFNERFFDWNHVSHNYWWWRWYYASSSASAPARQRNLKLPKSMLTARLRAATVDARSVSNLVDRIGLDLRIGRTLAPQNNGSFILQDGDAHLCVSRDGSFDARFAQPHRENRTPIAVERAMAAATDYVRELKLDQDVEVVFDRVRLAAEGGGAAKSAEAVDGPFVTETTVQFKQIINGLPVITPGIGEVHVSIDNDGRITSVHSSVRGVERLHESRPTEPGGSGPRTSNGPTATADYEQQLSAAWGRRIASFALRGPMPASFNVVPNTTEIGYDVQGNEARLAAQRAIEVDFGQGLRKRYWVSTPISS